MQMEMREFLVGGIAVGGGLMDAHRIREGTTEEVVVTAGNSTKDIGEVLFLGAVHVRESCEMGPREDHGFERPGCPERY